MMNVLYKEELDLSSLYHTRVKGELNISVYTLYTILICMYAKGVNLTSLLFIDLYRIYMYFVLCTLFDELTKKERILEFLYACLYFMFAYMCLH